MADRTWEERGRLMQKYDVRVRESGHIDSVDPARRPSRWRHFGRTEHVEAAIDDAIATCQRLERQAAERAKAEEERARQECRSPVADLLKAIEMEGKLNQPCVAGWRVRLAIEQQCAIWRKQATIHIGLDAYCAALRQCANDLEGNAAGNVVLMVDNRKAAAPTLTD